MVEKVAYIGAGESMPMPTAVGMEWPITKGSYDYHIDQLELLVCVQTPF